MFYALNKIALVGFYLVTLASVFVALPAPLTPEITHWMQLGALGLFAAHLLEIVVFRKAVALYRGPFVVSALLTLLFGFLHWKPLTDARR